MDSKRNDIYSMAYGYVWACFIGGGFAWALDPAAALVVVIACWAEKPGAVVKHGYLTVATGLALHLLGHTTAGAIYVGALTLLVALATVGALLRERV